MCSRCLVNHEGPWAGSNLPLPAELLFCLNTDICVLPHHGGVFWSLRRKSQSFSITCLGMGERRGTRAIARAYVSNDLTVLAAMVTAVVKGLHRDPVLGEHLQSSGCLEIGHGKVQEKPRLLKTIPEPHWNALPEYTEPERSWVLSYFIQFLFFWLDSFHWKFRTLQLSQGIRSKHARRLSRGSSLEDLCSEPLCSVLQRCLAPKSVAKGQPSPGKEGLGPKPKSLPLGPKSSSTAKEM